MKWLDSLIQRTLTRLGYVKTGASPVILETERKMRVKRAVVIAAMRGPSKQGRVAAFTDLFPIPRPPPFVPDAENLVAEMAADIKPHIEQAMDWGGNNSLSPAWGASGWHAANEGIGFFGYPYLAELTQRAEYRLISEIRAEEMTRKWIEWTYKGKSDKNGQRDSGQDRIDAIGEWFTKHQVKDKFQLITEQDGFFGRSHLYIDTGATDKPKELKTRLIRKAAKIGLGSVIALRVVEPLWTYPNRYNTNDPLKPDYFKPETWFVMGKLVHKSRLITFVSRPMPDLLKAAYAFGGLSLSQMAKPYVDNWLNARQSVADLIRAFSTMILHTDTQSALQGGDGEDLNNRLDLFNTYRSNFGTMVVNKDEEDLTSINVPLGSLDKLQAQAQEHQAAVARTPLVKLFGITPSGLNASSDGEIRVFYDGITAQQEKLYRPIIQDLSVIAQLDLFGDVDPDVGFSFVSLWELDEVAQAEIRKTDADTDGVLIEAGVLDRSESRKRIADDPKSPYAGLDVDELPDEPEDDDEEIEGAKPSASADPAKSAEPKSLQRSAV